VLTRAASVLRRICREADNPGETLESLLDQTLHAQGYAPLRTLCRKRLATLSKLTVGDFAVLERKHALTPCGSALEIVGTLAEEVAFKDGHSNKIGFL